MDKITKKSTLKDILSLKNGAQVLAEFDVPCMGCAFAHLEMDKLTLADICQMYGLDLDGILGALNNKEATKKVQPNKKNPPSLKATARQRKK